MLAQCRCHCRRVCEEGGKDSPIRGDDGILRIKHVERGRASVSVDLYLDAVAHVVDSLITKPVASRIRVSVGRCEGIHKPIEASVVADYDVRVQIKGKKRRELPNALAHVAAHQQSTLGANVVAKRHFGDITTIERDQRAAEETAEADAAIAFVRCQAICVALRIVEFLLTSLNVDIGIGQLAEVDLRPGDCETRDCALDGHVA